MNEYISHIVSTGHIVCIKLLSSMFVKSTSSIDGVLMQDDDGPSRTTTGILRGHGTREDEDEESDQR